MSVPLHCPHSDPCTAPATGDNLRTIGDAEYPRAGRWMRFRPSHRGDLRKAMPDVDRTKGRGTGGRRPARWCRQGGPGHASVPKGAVVNDTPRDWRSLNVRQAFEHLGAWRTARGPRECRRGSEGLCEALSGSRALLSGSAHVRNLDRSAQGFSRRRTPLMDPKRTTTPFSGGRVSVEGTSRRATKDPDGSASGDHLVWVWVSRGSVVAHPRNHR